MSIDLVVPSALGSTPQQVQDQSGNNSGLYLMNAGATTSTTYTVNLTPSGKLVFGLATGGQGEWLQNTYTFSNTWGISMFVNSKEQVRVTDGTCSVNAATVVIPNLTSGTGLDVQWLSGSGATAAGTLAVQTSSARFKDNIRELKDDFCRVLSLVPVKFNYKGTGQEGFGYTAEDVHEKELGNLVSYDEEGKPFGVNYKLLPVYLLEILKQQQETIARLEEGLARLLGDPAPAAQPATV